MHEYGITLVATRNRCDVSPAGHKLATGLLVPSSEALKVWPCIVFGRRVLARALRIVRSPDRKLSRNMERVVSVLACKQGGGTNILSQPHHRRYDQQSLILHPPFLIPHVLKMQGTGCIASTIDSHQSGQSSLVDDGPW
jgi:hypothetical protein